MGLFNNGVKFFFDFELELRCWNEIWFFFNSIGGKNEMRRIDFVNEFL